MGEHNNTVNGIKLEGSMGLVILILCIFGSGWGTLIAGFLSKNESDRTPAIIIGLIQIFTTWLLIGWIWAIMSGWKIYNNSK